MKADALSSDTAMEIGQQCCTRGTLRDVPKDQGDLGPQEDPVSPLTLDLQEVQGVQFLAVQVVLQENWNNSECTLRDDCLTQKFTKFKQDQCMNIVS